MALANASEVRIGYIAESAWGTTPSTPAFNVLRLRSEGIRIDKRSITSEEIRADRNVADEIVVAQPAEGDVNGELSYGTYDAFLESAFAGTWSTNVLTNGNTEKSFTFEKTFELGTTDQYHRFPGMIANTFRLDVAAQQLITCGFGFMGKGGSAASAIISGATYVAANTKGVMSAGVDFGSLSITGLAANPKIRSLRLNTSNNLIPQPIVGSVDLAGLGRGRFDVTGSMEVYFEDGDVFNSFLTHESLAITFTLGTVTTEKYTFLLPKVKITACQVVAGGANQDLMAAIDFRGIYDAGEACSLKITRAVA